jgi:hypothetical protein
MPGSVTLDFKDVLLESTIFRIPRIVAYNRLESRPRTTDFTRSLRAEVRDPLWMLTRQWQFGEFRGEDAASPLTARIAYRHYRTSMVALRDAPAFHYDPAEMPLETRVEREPVPFTLRSQAGGTEYNDIMFAVRWGKKLRKLVQAVPPGDLYKHYLDRFPLRVWPPDAPDRRIEDSEAQGIYTAVGKHIADGVAVWNAVRSGAHDTWLAGLGLAAEPQLKNVAAAFAEQVSNAVARMFSQPASADDSAWQSNHLEYQFAVGGRSAERQQQPLPVLRADQYHEGHLDWYSFDAYMNRPLAPSPNLAAGEGADVDPEKVESFLPAPVRFKGQPQPRFWEMEESQTDFGKIDTSTTGLLHLLLAEFGLIYSNDWFMLPHPMDVNTVCEASGILIDDTFGRHTFIRPAGRRTETNWQRFAMFHITEHGDRPDAAGNLFYLPPAAGKVLESEPIERVNFLRDEMANMVWGVEAIVPSQTGQGMSGYEASRPLPEKPPRTIEAEDVKISYVVGTTVPANWTPFIPVHVEGSVSEIRLQRARMAGGVPPRGRLLREGKSPYFVEEEEIQRTGAFVERSWQRTRWIGGRTLLWVGRRKTAGRGEGWSNLVFDQIQDMAPKPAP